MMSAVPVARPAHGDDFMVNNSPVRVLLVEDDEDDYLLARELIESIPGRAFALTWVPAYDEALAAMADNHHDVYLLDYRLGLRTGLELLREARAAGCKGPAILLTGRGDRELALEALAAGAADYVSKGSNDAVLLERSLRYALERHHAAQALRRAHDELETRVAERTAELSQANALLAEAARRKDEFLAMLGHELRNPLAPIVNGLHILRLAGDETAPREQARALIERQVRHLTRLVDDLLDVSRITRGKIRLSMERVDLARLARSVAEDRRRTLEHAGLKLVLDLPETPVWVSADGTRMAQVLNNLLDNAAKFTDREGTVVVRLRREPDAARVALSVKDSGIGLEPDLLPHVFDVFSQADRSLERSRGGLGLGLALVRGLVELHGGTVAAASEGPDRGAEFTVHLRAEAEPAALEDLSPAPQAQGGERLRLLVVEDHRDAAESLRALLELLGHEVAVAHSGPEGVRTARAMQPEIVLSDIGLPGLDGYGVARALRADPRTARACLIAITGYGQEEDRCRARQAGFDYHLTKPVAPETLQKLLRRRVGTG
jgi:signal transduction histidine kinase